MKTINLFRNTLTIALLTLCTMAMAQSPHAHGKRHQGKEYRSNPPRDGKHASVKVIHKHAAPVNVYSYHTTPRVVYAHAPSVRYVYYRNYDVYYDQVGKGFYTFNGRRWVFSSARPQRIQYVDLARVPHVAEVYHRDDFGRHLESTRPMGRPVRR